MPVEVKRKANENTYGLMRRFSDKVKKGRVLTLTKKNMYFQKKTNKTQQKQDAIRRKYNRDKREFLIKTGKITEEAIIGGNRGFKKR